MHSSLGVGKRKGTRRVTSIQTRLVRNTESSCVPLLCTSPCLAAIHYSFLVFLISCKHFLLFCSICLFTAVGNDFLATAVPSSIYWPASTLPFCICYVCSMPYSRPGLPHLLLMAAGTLPDQAALCFLLNSGKVALEIENQNNKGVICLLFFSYYQISWTLPLETRGLSPFK